MYSSPFDGNAAFSGGGFMPSQATLAPESSFSPFKNRDARSLFPLTVKQIRDLSTSSDESSFSINGVEVNTVTVVGMVCNKDEKKITEVVFIIDDGTGSIECNRWVHERVDSNEMEGIVSGMYVRVHGHLKGFQGKRAISAFAVKPVTDFNEITYHFIECVSVHLYNTRLRLQGGMTTQPQMTNPGISTPVKADQAASFNQFSGQVNVDGVNNVDQMVLNFLQQPACLADENGVHRNVIAQQLNIPMDKIMEALENLVDNGMAYPTIDEDHFKSSVNA